MFNDPTWLQDKGPFPTYFVSDITPSQIEYVQDVCDLREDTEDLIWWRIIFNAVNDIFMYELPLEQGRAIASEMERLVPDSILPQVFLILAHCYEVNRLIPDLIDEKRYRRNPLPKLAGQVSEQTAKADKAIEDLAKALKDLTALGEQYDLIRPVLKWVAHDGPTLLELRKRLETTNYQVTWAVREFQKSWYENIPGSMKKGEKPDFIYRAFDAVACLIGEYKGKKTRAVKDAGVVFSIWGIVIDEEAERVARKRRKSGT